MSAAAEIDAQNEQKDSPERRTADSLPSAMLLAFAGGSLDAFLYLNHGRVFAGAMTGNAVLCGVALLREDRHSALQHTLPIAAFIVGVWGAEALASRLRSHAIIVGLLAETAGLLACSFLPLSFPDLAFVPLISMLAAYQVASFRKADDYSYNSTFITGDLRTAVVGLYQAFDPKRRADGLRQARELGLIVASFAVGAVVSAALAGRTTNHTLWLPAMALLLVLCRVLLKTRKT